jgi:hypothetical protein
LNGERIFEETQEAEWRKTAPCYAPEKTVVNLRSGENRLVFETKFTSLHWELFFKMDGLGIGELWEMDWESGVELSETAKTVSPRPWFPPKLSQTSYGYAAFAGLLSADELKQSVANSYPRNYPSVRIPLFSDITACRDKLKNWIMPCNTPWPAFFYLSALFDAGLSHEALDWMRMAWGVMLDENAVNTWEEWNHNSSLCHAWGAAPAYFFQHEVLGVKLERLHENVIEFRPNLCGLEFAEGTVALPDGKQIHVRLEAGNGETLSQIVEAPEGYTVER